MKPNVRLIFGAGFIVGGLVCWSTAAVSQERLKEGLTLLNDGKTDSALTVLRQAVNEDPSDPSEHTALASANHALGKMACRHVHKVDVNNRKFR